ncbi:MAG: ATP-binding protein [Bacillota bacterium]|nr:ATP-binding protein [Bacillota bacterium]
MNNNRRTSLVFKLNMRLALRLFSIFIVLDIFVCAAMGITVIARAETLAKQVAAGSASFEALPLKWQNALNCEISLLSEKPKGAKIPLLLMPLYPANTSGGIRRLEVRSQAGSGFLSRLRATYYHVAVPEGRGYIDIAIPFSEEISYLQNLIFLLFIIELILLIKNMHSNARLIKKSLRPISELAETAKSLNKANKQAPLPLEKMEAIAGKLNNINASRLDTRISVDETQNELKNLAEAINGMLDRINEAYRSQARFVSDASHELRTPISVIQGYANLLDRWGKNDEKTLQESIDAIKDEASNMKALVEQLLFLARGDNNTITLITERFDLTELCSEVMRETQMIDGGHEYESRLAPVSVYADKALIKQAMRIVVDNAIKYTPPGGHIIAALSESDGFAKISVQDDGIGIPPEAVPQVFDRFFRAEESRARKTGGTGLGLSIAKWISERHNGHMEVLSRENIGTRIIIAIPVKESLAPQTLIND